MLSLAALVSLTCATAVPTTPFMIVSKQDDRQFISVVDMQTRSDGVVAELFELFPKLPGSSFSNCIEFESTRACMVRLESSADLVSTAVNLPEPGAWEVAFRGAAAKEIQDLLEAHEKSEGTRGVYLISQAGHVACESEGPICVIRSKAQPVVHFQAQ